MPNLPFVFYFCQQIFDYFLLLKLFYFANKIYFKRCPLCLVIYFLHTCLILWRILSSALWPEDVSESVCVCRHHRVYSRPVLLCCMRCCEPNNVILVRCLPGACFGLSMLRAKSKVSLRSVHLLVCTTIIPFWLNLSVPD